MSDQLNVELQIHLARDDETGWWYIAASDIPGLVLEAKTPAGLIQKIEEAAPEMIELNYDEIVGRHGEGSRGRKGAALDRPAWAYRPVFDSPLAA